MTASPERAEGLLRAALPVAAVVSFAIVAAAIARSAGDLLGYDFQAYVSAARRVLAREPLYDATVAVAGGFAIYLYPPPFALAFIPFALLPDGVGVGIWTVLLGVAFVAGAALLPVRFSIRWVIVLLAAVDWPVLYSIKLGQVGPILFLLFAIGWRAMDRPGILAAAIAGGAMTKIQPIALAGWALLTGRWRAAALAVAGVLALAALSTIVVGFGAWADYAALLGRVSSAITTPHNFAPGAIAYQLGMGEGLAASIQAASTILAAAASLVAIRFASPAASFVVVVVATQLVSPLLWDHYAILLLLPVAYLLDRGQWWAVAIPLLTSLPLLGLVPAAIYPIEFVVCLIAADHREPAILVTRRDRSRTGSAGSRMTWAKIARDALVLLGIIAAVVYWIFLTRTGGSPVDVHAFWVADPHHLYPNRELAKDGYYYTPAFEFVVGWWRGLPFEVFVAIWRAILLAILVYLAGPFTLFVLFTVPVASEINAGNIQLMLALAVVLGFRWPATWAFVILTKLTPGIGLLWFALRREWRALAIALGVTAAIAAVSFLMMPSAWAAYVALLTGSPAPSVAPYYLPLWVRLPVAIAVIGLGAWKGYRWPVVVGATLALPVYYIISTSMLVGVLPFARQALGRWLADRQRPLPEPEPVA